MKETVKWVFFSEHSVVSYCLSIDFKRVTSNHHFVLNSVLCQHVWAFDAWLSTLKLA